MLVPLDTWDIRAEKEHCMPSPNQKSDIYDVIVVGASFAGLSFASVAAALGLRVLVVERDAEVGGVVRTTGILFNDTLDFVDVPARYLMNAIRRIQLQPPDHPPIEVSARAYRFYMVDVPGMLRWMSAQAEERGAIVRCGAMFLDAIRQEDGVMLVTLGVPATPPDPHPLSPPSLTHPHPPH